jgi:hypothetical protein
MIGPIKHRIDCDMAKRNAGDEVIIYRIGGWAVVSSILKDTMTGDHGFLMRRYTSAVCFTFPFYSVLRSTYD